MLLSLSVFLVFYYFNGIPNENELIKLTFLLSFIFIILIILPSFVLIKNKKDLYEGFALITAGIMLVSFFSVSFFFLGSSFIKVFDEPVCEIKNCQIEQNLINANKNLLDSLNSCRKEFYDLKQRLNEADRNANQ